jgi:hypothetical protein
LIRDIVPKYFVQSKYESFTRQLNGWGFKRLHQSGNDFNAYYHECFLRGMPHLTVLLKRVAPNQGKLLPHVEGEPNFYEIEKQFPLPPHYNMMPYQGFQGYPLPYSSALGSGYHAGAFPPSEMPARTFSFYPGSYPPPPQPYYGHISDPSTAAAATQMNGFPPYPSFYTTQYGYPPHEQYPENPPASYSLNHSQGAPVVVRDNSPVKREEGLVPAVQGSMTGPFSNDDQNRKSLESTLDFNESPDPNRPNNE